MATTYTWKKYNIANTYTMLESNIQDSITVLGITVTFIKTITFDSSTGEIWYDETTARSMKLQEVSNFSNDSSLNSTNYPYFATGDNVKYFYGSPSYFLTTPSLRGHLLTRSDPIYSKGSYVDTVTASSSNAYPDDGQSGDYWYVYNGTIANSKPTGVITVPELKAGKSATIAWTTSDADGETVRTTKLVRYLKLSGSSSYTATTLINSSTTSTSYVDTIPENAADGSVYYKLTITDGTDSVDITSDTYDIPVTNSPPTGTITVPELKAGKSAVITWNTSDVDGDTIRATKLVRHLKRSGDSSYTSTTLFSSATTNTSYSDTIPLDANKGSVYYKLTITDGTDSVDITSNTYNISGYSPKISGSDSSLGTYALVAPSYTYTVTHEGALSTTVTESLDGKVIKTYTASLGASRSVTISDLTWLKTLNGSHTLKITATDSDGQTAVRTLTLTKKVTSLSFTLEKPFDADAQITKALENIIAGIPSGAAISIEICNNGYDASPTWEDMTQKVLNGEKLFFENTTKTAENWGYNVRVTMQRNNAVGECYVFSMTGFFE